MPRAQGRAGTFELCVAVLFQPVDYPRAKRARILDTGEYVTSALTLPSSTAARSAAQCREERVELAIAITSGTAGFVPSADLRVDNLVEQPCN